MRIPTVLQQKLDEARLADLSVLWPELNSSTEISGAPLPEQHIRQHASRAAKWIAVALTPSMIEAGIRPAMSAVQSRQSEILLSEVVARDPNELGRQARAAYLVTFLGIPLDRAHEPTDVLGLGRERRKINNVSESVRRCLRFLAPYYLARGDAQGSLWPSGEGVPGLRAGLRFYRQIRDMQVVRGVMDPASFKPAYVQEVADAIGDRFVEVRKAGDYNKALRELRKLLESGLLPPLGPDLVAGLQEFTMNPDRAEARAFSDAELIRRWPQEFPSDPSSPSHVDRRRGLLGFFSKDAGLQRPTNRCGMLCSARNRLGHHAVEGRIAALKRYLHRVVEHFGEDSTRALPDCFCPEALQWWLPSYLAERDVVTAMHRDEYLEVTCTARLYFDVDITVVARIAEEVDFPHVGESMKGSEVLKLAGSPLALTKWADAFRDYANAAPKPTTDRPSGLYYPRKSLEIDVLLRTDTGIRPENLDGIEVRTGPPVPGYSKPSIWWDPRAGVYTIRIPRDLMKQHKRSYASTVPQAGGRGARRPYEFIIWRARTIRALHEYLACWKFARGVAAGRTIALYLNREGTAYESGGFGNSFNAKKHYVAREWKRQTGEELPVLDRYAHRHLMGEFLRRHIPGGNLKSWYLTHRSDEGSDRNYGDDDAALLHECIDEILAGTPPRPKQEVQRWEQQGAQIDHVIQRLASVNDSMEVTVETLALFKEFLAERQRSNSARATATQRQRPPK